MLTDFDTKTRFPAGSPERQLFANQLDWFEQGPAPALPAPPAAVQLNANGDIQGGILNDGYGATHSALLLIAFDDAASAQTFLASLMATSPAGLRVTSEADATATSGQAGVIYTNIAFTYQGLQQLGLTDEQLDAFPQEFREGMEARSSTLGDVRSNHPLNWSLPERNWPANPGSAVQLSMVHAVVQLSVRGSSTSVPGDHEVVGNPSHPLFNSVTTLAGRLGTQLLSVQAMRRRTDPQGRVREHFGFVDGQSQPELGPVHGTVGQEWTNKTTWGELLLGYPNDQDDPLPQPGDNPLVAAGLWTNSTFLVIRKLSQDVAALQRVLDDGSARCGLTGDELKEKIVGRQLATGDPLVNHKSINDFTYAGDPLGSQCPFQAHIRRANPRDAQERLVPRIVRRGMSYGPAYADDPNAERGLVFMAYNARIAEQFEVIQRWVAGGNSTYVFSGESDPLLGVPQVGAPRTFRFQDAGQVRRIILDPPASPPLVRLRWGTYLFVPSLTALGQLIEIAAKAASPAADLPWSSDAGEQVIKQLSTLPQKAEVMWKAVLEDPINRLSHTTDSVWAAIRKNHGGVLKTPYGVLVGSRDLVMNVLQNGSDFYSVQGYAGRMGSSFGVAYVGLDDGPQYQAESTGMNSAIMGVTEADAFDRAFRATKGVLDAYIAAAKSYYATQKAAVWELPLNMGDVADIVLYQLYTEWFGIAGQPALLPGGWRSEWTSPSAAPPRCPGHFIAPALYVFQPNPGPMETEFGTAHGQALLKVFQALAANGRSAAPTGGLGQAAFAAFPNASGNDLLARTLIGVLAGFLSTTYAYSRTCLIEWISDGTLWEMEGAISTGGQTYDQVRAVLGDPLCRTMQRSPGLQLIWRTAVKAHKLGDVDVQPNDKIVLGLGSAAQEALEAGRVDPGPLFGGDRSAASHPTHACPGYAMGMGVLLGILTATIASRPQRPGPGPLMLTWSGTLP
jgi:Dyp-type peroxidase family